MTSDLYNIWWEDNGVSPSDTLDLSLIPPAYTSAASSLFPRLIVFSYSFPTVLISSVALQYVLSFPVFLMFFSSPHSSFAEI